MTTRTALIIGGGIAGPVTAMALQKAGIDAAVYEAHPERTDGAGGGFTLAPNGLAALDALGLGDLVRPAGREITAYVLQDWKGRPLAEFGNPTGVAPMQFFYRRDLYRALHEEALRRGIRITYGKRLTGVREEDGAITALIGPKKRPINTLLPPCLAKNRVPFGNRSGLRVNGQIRAIPPP